MRKPRNTLKLKKLRLPTGKQKASRKQGGYRHNRPIRKNDCFSQRKPRENNPTKLKMATSKIRKENEFPLTPNMTPTPLSTLVKLDL